MYAYATLLCNVYNFEFECSHVHVCRTRVRTGSRACPHASAHDHTGTRSRATRWADRLGPVTDPTRQVRAYGIAEARRHTKRGETLTHAQLPRACAATAARVGRPRVLTHASACTLLVCTRLTIMLVVHLSFGLRARFPVAACVRAVL